MKSGIKLNSGRQRGQQLIGVGLLGLVLWLGGGEQALAQRGMKVADLPPQQQAPRVQWINGYTPEHPARGTFYAARSGATKANPAWRNMTHEPVRPLKLIETATVPQPLAVAPQAPPNAVYTEAYQGAKTSSVLISFETQDYDDNITLTSGKAFIPPDSHGAAGPEDVVVVNNVTIASYSEATGAVSGLAKTSLKAFFGSVTETFDPKIVYDPFSTRFVLVTLEREDVAAFGDAADASRILLAASPPGTPAGAWTAISIDAKLTIGPDDTWCDYPGLAVDEEAVYVTCNQFKFGTSPGTSVGQRLWTVDKAKFYAGTLTGSDVFTYDPATAAGPSFHDMTMMPAQVHSDPGGVIGTWLMGYTGLSDGLFESIQVIRVDSPLGGGSAVFTGFFVSMGNVDEHTASFGDAPQLGSATAIETNNRRLLDAVWRSDRLWGVTTVIPPAGPDAGHETAHFVQMSTTSGTPTLVNQGDVGAEDLGTGTVTFFPSIDVNGSCAVMGFAASSTAMFAGAYYVGINPATGATGSTLTLRAGEDFYVRTFGGTDNRWGDYSGTVLDFDDGTAASPTTDEASFWIFNEYAKTRAGTPDVNGHDGRWGQRAAQEACGGVLPVELGPLSAVANGRTVTLSWETFSETNNVGFEVEHRAAGMPEASWQTLGFVPGSGTAAERKAYTFRTEDVPPGPQAFRLKQLNLDGSFSYTPAVEVFVALPVAYDLSDAFPNPFDRQARFTLMVRTAQEVRVRVYDILGREVQVLHDGELVPGIRHTFVFDGAALPSGLYVYRVEGETFSAVKTMLLVK